MAAGGRHSAWGQASHFNIHAPPNPPTFTPAREAGFVYTKPWRVELVLDLAGYLPEKRLADFVALEPSAGDGAFLSAMARPWFA